MAVRIRPAVYFDNLPCFCKACGIKKRYASMGIAFFVYLLTSRRFKHSQSKKHRQGCDNNIAEIEGMGENAAYYGKQADC